MQFSNGRVLCKVSFGVTGTEVLGSARSWVWLLSGREYKKGFCLSAQLRLIRCVVDRISVPKRFLWIDLLAVSST